MIFHWPMLEPKRTVQVAEAPDPVGLHLLLEAKLEADHSAAEDLDAAQLVRSALEDDEEA